eukprot:gene18221-24672_t
MFITDLPQDGSGLGFEQESNAVRRDSDDSLTGVPRGPCTCLHVSNGSVQREVNGLGGESNGGPRGSPTRPSQIQRESNAVQRLDQARSADPPAPVVDLTRHFNLSCLPIHKKLSTFASAIASSPPPHLQPASTLVFTFPNEQRTCRLETLKAAADNVAPAETAPPSDPVPNHSPGIANGTLDNGIANGSMENGAAIGSMQNGNIERATFEANHSLSKQQVERYSRHLLLPSFGLNAQERLCGGSVLIVGCGGLGSPAALYLAAAGVGTLGLADNDVVESSNLHRQIIHTERSCGQPKTQSAKVAAEALNGSVKIKVHDEGLTAANAVEIVSQYDVVLDCSDNPPTRYLVSDACVATNRPLVSAAAVGTDGQLTVYHYGQEGPCYRCLFPEAPAPENCSRCADAGVLGVVPGIMGSLQALEAIKVLSQKGDVLTRKFESPTITADSIASFDYYGFTGQSQLPASLDLIPTSDRIDIKSFKSKFETLRSNGQPFVLLDVRPSVQFDLVHLPESLNIPVDQLPARVNEVKDMLAAAGSAVAAGDQEVAAAAAYGAMSEAAALAQSKAKAAADSIPVFVMCRRGNASQKAVLKLREAGVKQAIDIMGGMNEWAREFDPTMPTL